MDYTIKKIAIIESDWLFENMDKLYKGKSSVKYDKEAECFELSTEELLDNKIRKRLEIPRTEAIKLIKQCDSMMVYKKNK